MLQPLSADPQAIWKRRFRAPTLVWSQIAQQAPERGLVLSDLSGSYQLHAWDVPSGNLRQISHEPKGAFVGRLSGDGRYIYYLHDDDGDEIGHFIRVPFEGGEPHNLTPDLPPYLADPFINPTGTMLGFLVGKSTGVDLYIVPIGPDESIGSVRHVYHNPLPGLHGRKLVALSSSGTTAVMISQPHNPFMYGQLLSIDLASGDVIDTLQEEQGGYVSMGDYSPVVGDERLWATLHHGDTQQHLIWNPQSGERISLVLDTLAGGFTPCSWSPDGRRLLLKHDQQDETRFAIYTLADHSIHVPGNLSGTYWCSYFGNAHEIYTHWGMIQDGTVLGPEIRALDTNKGGPRCTLLALEQVPAGRPWRSITFPSSDGQEIQAWLITPGGDGPYPTIIDLHGGPHTQRTVDPAPDLQMWVDHGFAVCSVNYRGSTGFGQAFQDQVLGNPGYWEVEDIVAARHWLVNTGIADPQAVLLTGWSYGGYLTLLALGKYPKLWLAGMAGIAIADWALLYEDTHEALRPTRLLGGTPAERPEQYRVSSPVTYAEQVEAPILVIQGRNDYGCPPRQMERYVAHLQTLGKRIEIDWFDSGHGSLVVEEKIAQYERMLTFAYAVLSQDHSR